ncbi:MAG TPA: dihydrofolate reductase family protein [Candidatus Saccharimonadales bacterium]|nr:dihydrofolate reductase family protein [Candidatus Saccharimonadales bacterium]
MKVRMFMALSPNGYAARENGSEDWVSGANWPIFSGMAHEADNLVIGRETYELIKSLYGDDMDLDDVPAQHKIIVTRNEAYECPLGYTVCHNPQAAVDYLAGKGVKTTFLTGGGKLNASFLEAKLVDEIVLVVEPHIIGTGRPAMAPGNYELSLQLKSTTQLDGERVQLEYKVKRK